MNPDVHRTYIRRQALCAPGVMDTRGTGVHHVYMKKSKGGGKSREWRPNFIRRWRERARFSQEQVAEILEEAGLISTHASVGRIENGKQIPKINTLEEMARLYRTDVDSMINRPPPDDEPIPPAPPVRQPKRR